MLIDIEELAEEYKVKPFDFVSEKYFYYSKSPYVDNYIAFACVRHAYEYFILVGENLRKFRPTVKNPLIAVSDPDRGWYLMKAKMGNDYPLWKPSKHPHKYHRRQIAKYEKHYNQ